MNKQGRRSRFREYQSALPDNYLLYLCSQLKQKHCERIYACIRRLLQAGKKPEKAPSLPPSEHTVQWQAEYQTTLEHKKQPLRQNSSSRSEFPPRYKYYTYVKNAFTYTPRGWQGFSAQTQRVSSALVKHIFQHLRMGCNCLGTAAPNVVLSARGTQCALQILI